MDTSLKYPSSNGTRGAVDRLEIVPGRLVVRGEGAGGLREHAQVGADGVGLRLARGLLCGHHAVRGLRTPDRVGIGEVGAARRAHHGLGVGLGEGAHVHRAAGQGLAHAHHARKERHAVVGVGLAALGHGAVANELERVEAQRAHAQALASGREELLHVADGTLACDQFDPRLPGAAHDAQVARAFRIGGHGGGPGAVDQVELVRHQRLERFGRTVELVQDDVQTRLLEQAARLCQQQVLHASRRQMSDGEQRAAGSGLGPGGGGNLRKPGRGDGQCARTAAAEETPAGRHAMHARVGGDRFEGVGSLHGRLPAACPVAW